MKKKMLGIFVVTLFLVATGINVNADDERMTEVWEERYQETGDYYDELSSMAVDSSGNVYVTGRSVGSTNNVNYTTVSYGPNGGIPRWVKPYDGPISESDYAKDIAVDRGVVYVTGGAMFDTPTHVDYVTIAYDSDNGDYIWNFPHIARYNGPGNSYDHAYAIAVDGDGDVIVTGVSSGSGSLDYLTIKYDSSNGAELWKTWYDGPGNSNDHAYDIAVDGDDNVYVTGVSGSDCTTIKYDSDGKELWVTRDDGPDNLGAETYSIAVDGGYVYAAGNSEGTGTSGLKRIMDL
jgi:outer membrane protein assembly factor BamB